MVKLKKFDQEVGKNLNRQIILNYIRKSNEISRVELTEHTKLSPTTVSAITSSLIQEKIVREIGIGESSGGRRPLMLGINPEAKFVLTIVLSREKAECSIVNLNYEVKYKESISCDICDSVEAENVLCKAIDLLMKKFPYGTDKICGIGISVPGVVDRKNGKILYSSKLKLRDFDIASAVSRYTDIKCFLFRDTDALILGEYNFGIGKAIRNFIYINIENGVGMSYINSGRLFHPGYGGGLELGHITIDLGGKLCRCGNKGCLGTVVSEIPAVSKLKEYINEGYNPDIQDINDVKLLDIVELSNSGDKACSLVLEEQAGLLGTAVASVINLFNPELVAIGGPLVKCNWGFLDILRTTVQERALDTYSSSINIDFAKLGEDSALVGMANEIIESEVFKPVEI